MAGPNATLDVSDAALGMIAGYEGWRAQLYEDVAGHATIGYGHLVHRGPITAADRSGPFGKGITKAQGMKLLREDARSAVTAVRDAVTVPLNQGQFDALVSFTYNVGSGALRRSTLLKKVNTKDFAGAADEFGKWVKAGGKVYQGLVRRRTEEAALFRGGAAPRGTGGASGGRSTGGGGTAGWPPARVLRSGDRGPDVAELQRRLGVGADGVFGPKTEAAVKAFQKSKRLGVDGVVGPKTAAKL